MRILLICTILVTFSSCDFLLKESVDHERDYINNDSQQPKENENSADNEIIEEDCVFDRATQTDEFLKGIPEFANYTWYDTLKTAIAILENGDTVTISRGGCDHFGFYIGLKTAKTDSNNTDNMHCFQQVYNLATLLYHDSELQLIDSLVSHELYEEEIYDQIYTIRFDQELFCDMSFNIDRRNEGFILIDIGYYIC